MYFVVENFWSFSIHLWFGFLLSTEASANHIFLEAKIHQGISNLGMLEAETETNEEEATEETYHDDKRSRVAVKKIKLMIIFFP